MRYSTRRAMRRSARQHLRQSSAAARIGLRVPTLALEGDGDVLADGQRREQAGVLERAAEARGARARPGRDRVDVGAVDDDARRRPA